MKLSPLICTIWLVASCPSWAGDQEKRFLEFPSGIDTTTFDLTTVQMVQPGRFTIISTTIDDLDVMKFELTVLDTLRAYCTRPDGKYPAPAKLLALGPPDMPIKSIEVRNQNQTRTVEWDYPYKRLAIETTAGIMERPFLPVFCESPKVSTHQRSHQLCPLCPFQPGRRSAGVLGCRAVRDRSLHVAARPALLPG